MTPRRAGIIQALRATGALLLALFIVGSWYMAVAALSAVLPVSGRPQIPAAPGQAVFLCEAPYHTDIALPLQDPQMNWRGELAGALPSWLGPETYLLVGWGDAVFFSQVLHPDDMTPARAMSAIAGINPTAVRIVPVDARSVADHCMRLDVDPQGRKEIIEHIRASFRPGPDGRPQIITTPVSGEILIRARGRYSLFNTCNQWTATALGKAGLPRALFAPFSASVTGPLRAAHPPHRP